MSFLDKAESLTEAAQRALLEPRLALAPEYPPGAITPYFKPNGSIDPDDPAYVSARQQNFADWKLEVGGLVERPMSLSLADLRALPSRSQITRHDCVEGWSCIGQWKGAQLSALLEGGGPEAAGALHRLLLRRHARADARRHRALLRDHRPDRRLPSPDHPRLRDERRPAARSSTARRCGCGSSASSATRWPSTSCASRRSTASPLSAAAAAASGKTAATSGTRGSEGGRFSEGTDNFLTTGPGRGVMALTVVTAHSPSKDGRLPTPYVPASFWADSRVDFARDNDRRRSADHRDRLRWITLLS